MSRIYNLIKGDEVIGYRVIEDIKRILLTESKIAEGKYIDKKEDIGEGCYNSCHGCLGNYKNLCVQRLMKDGLIEEVYRDE